jgi:hypothetical protein
VTTSNPSPMTSSHRPRLRPLAALLAIALVAGPLGGSAFAHSERPMESPPRPGDWPNPDRVQPHVVVCKSSSKPSAAAHDRIHARMATARGGALRQLKARDANWHWNAKLWPQCKYRDIQAAVNAVKGNIDILVMPGRYEEHPSRAIKDLPADNEDGTYSYGFHKANPNVANLIGIMGKENVTLAGTGFSRNDVVIDAEFKKHVAIRTDRSDGFVAKNFSVFRGIEHGLYTVETDGYWFENVYGAYSGAYELFAFASDHGMMKDCEAVGAGDAGLYVGGGPYAGRVANIIENCDVHHNALGFSGTNDNDQVIRNSRFWDNAAGIVFDAEGDHPGYHTGSPNILGPQGARIVGNQIWDNNFNIYSTKSNVKPIGTLRNQVHVLGVGIVLSSFSFNVIRGNWIWGNNLAGVAIVSAFQVGGELPPTTNPETLDKRGARSSYNLTAGNWMTRPGGIEDPNGVDLFWDGLGEGNCFDDNYGASSTPESLPYCEGPGSSLGVPSLQSPHAMNIAIEMGHVVVDSETGELVCNTTGTLPCPSGPGPEYGDNTPGPGSDDEGDPY